MFELEEFPPPANSPPDSPATNEQMERSQPAGPGRCKAGAGAGEGCCVHVAMTDRASQNAEEAAGCVPRILVKGN